MNNKPFEITFSYALQWWTAGVAADFQLVLTHQNNFAYTSQLFRTVWTPKYVEIAGEWNPCFVTRFIAVNPLKPNKPYRGRTAPLTSKVAYCIFIQQIYVQNILNMVYTLRFFLFKM